MQGTAELQKTLVAEMRSRIKEDDSTLPTRKQGYYYYMRHVTNQQYPVTCRRKMRPQFSASYSQHDVMDDKSSEPEEVLLDQNVDAEGTSYYNTTGMSPSESHRYLCFGKDTTGSELYTLHFLDTQNKDSQGQPTLMKVNSNPCARACARVYVRVHVCACVCMCVCVCVRACLPPLLFVRFCVPTGPHQTELNSDKHKRFFLVLRGCRTRLQTRRALWCGSGTPMSFTQPLTKPSDQTRSAPTTRTQPLPLCWHSFTHSLTPCLCCRFGCTKSVVKLLMCCCITSQTQSLRCTRPCPEQSGSSTSPPRAPSPPKCSWLRRPFPTKARLPSPPSWGEKT